MAEIRSTLDIIMEKAQEVVVTDEDKIAFKKKELEGKIRGFLQRFQDQIMNEDRLIKELTAIGIQEQQMVRDIFFEDCLSRINPEVDNTRLLDLMKKTAGLDVSPFLEILEKYQEEINQERNRCKSVLTEKYQGRGISGSAVMPNLEADPLWVDLKVIMKQGFMKSLSELQL